jgi:predicted nucleic acid-binding protein
VAEQPIIDASPFILLAKAELLDLLKLEGDRVLLTDAVEREIRAHELDVAARALDELAWLEVVQTPEIPAGMLAWDLGAGETSVLAWAQAHPGTRAILDDKAARRCAETWRVPVRGTLGLVILARQAGLIGAARPAIEKLSSVGMYLDAALVQSLLEMVNE